MWDLFNLVPSPRWYCIHGAEVPNLFGVLSLKTKKCLLLIHGHCLHMDRLSTFKTFMLIIYIYFCINSKIIVLSMSCR